MKPELFVSRCLLGEAVRYDSSTATLSRENLERLNQFFHVIPICPEVLGGLSVPREPSEIKEGRVFSFSGRDLTDSFLNGAESCLSLVSEIPAMALLKEKSPSCGSKWIYDGSFSGKLIPGEGLTTTLFRSRGIIVYSDSELEALFSSCSFCQDSR